MRQQRFALFKKLRKQSPSWVVKKIFLNIILTILLILPIFTFIIIRDLERDVDSNDKEPWLRWYDDPSESIVISWETDSNTSTYLEWGISASNLSENVTIAGNVGVHHVYLNGLLPNTKYYYRVGASNTSTGNTYSFMTAPATENVPFTFLAISDTQESELGISHHARVAAAINDEPNARFVVHGGDVADHGSIQESWNYFFKHSSRYTPNIPLVFTLGNHDNKINQPMYRKYYAFNQTNELLYYSFNYSSLHVISLKFPYGNDGEFKPAMLSWLADDLNKSASKQFKLVVFHCPMLSSSFFGRHRRMEAELHPLFDQYNVTLVINGHSHHYERCLLDGVTYSIVAGGGGLMDPCHNTLPETQAIHSIPHYVRVRVDPSTGMKYEALMPDGTVFDSVLLQGGVP